MLALVVQDQAQNLFVVLLMMLHPAQELEPPEEPARFKQTSAEHHGDDQRQLHHARGRHHGAC